RGSGGFAAIPSHEAVRRRDGAFALSRVSVIACTARGRRAMLTLRRVRVSEINIGVIVNGATGRIGSTQHLANALVPIIREGGLVAGGNRVMPRVKLVGRDADKLAQVAAAQGLTDWTTDLDAALADPEFAVFFDAAATNQRHQVLDKAIAAGKHIYT